jgi:hypothetical protein
VTKSITTLVEDIRQVLSGEAQVRTEDAEALGKTLSLRIADRLCEGQKYNHLRMSNFYYGDRKLWYAVNQPELAAPLEPEAKQKFLYGDIIEAELLFLAKAAGHDVTCEQQEVSYHGVLGHIDAVIDGLVVDVKSASGRAFDKFKYHQLEYNDPFGYIDQLSLYVTAMADNPEVKIKGQGGFLAVNKESGEIALDIYKINKRDYEQEIVRKSRMLERDQLPDRCHTPVPYGSSGNKRLSVECAYCPFKRDCWKQSNYGKGIRSFAYSSGVVELVEVHREPEVQEITQ